jgi:hypothetical protein
LVLGGFLALACGGCAAGITGSPIAVTATGATVDGRVVSNAGGVVEYWAQFGPTRAYGSETAHSTATVERNVPLPVSVDVDGLARSTTYHYRLCASDSQQTGGPACGADRTLTTQSFACGETITGSVRLTGNLSCPFDVPYALVIGADGIDVNLAGYRLAGAIVSGGGTGSILNEGHADVTIRNGRTTGVIQLSDASRNLIRDVDVLSVGAAGIAIEGGSANEIRATRVDSRGEGISAVSSNDLVVANSDVTGMTGPGIGVTGDRARLVRNRLMRSTPNGTAIQLTGSGGRVVDNVVSGPWLGGGIVLLGGSGNLIAENDVSGGVAVLGSDRGGDGIFVEDLATGTILRYNITHENAGDGMEIQGPGARLRGNAANGNGDFGIDAAAGTVDLGGNSASGNGNPLQCRNVFCS